MKKLINRVTSNTLLSGSLVMIFGSNFTNALNYLYHLVMGKSLSLQNYGELASLLSLIGITGIVPSALGLVVIKAVASTEDETSKYLFIKWLRGKAFWGGIVFTILLIILSKPLATFLKIADQFDVLLISLTFLFSLWSLFNRAVLQGLLKFGQHVVSVLVENLTKLLLGVVLVYLGFGVKGAIVGLLIASLIGWLLTNKNIKRKLPQNNQLWDQLNLNSLAIFAVPVLIQTAAFTGLYSADLILVKHFFNSTDAAFYAALSNLGKIIFFGVSPIAAVMFPLISRKSAKNEDYQKILLTSLLLTAGACLIGLIFYTLIPSFFITLLYDKRYLIIGNLLPWYSLFIIFYTLSSLLVNYYLSIGRVKVVCLPMLFALMQVVLIFIYHNSLFQVIMMSLMSSSLLLISLFVYFAYVYQFSFRHHTRL